MDAGKPNDPNIDGDFVSLWSKREGKQNADDELKEFLEDFDEPNRRDSVFPSRKDSIYPSKVAQLNKPLSPPTPKSTESASIPPLNTDDTADDINSLSNALFEAVGKDNAQKFASLVELVITNQKSLTDFRHKDTTRTVLNQALENCHYSVARYLIDHFNEDLLLEDYRLTVKGVSTQKSNLHILSEKGNFVLTKLIMDKLKNEVRDEYLSRVVLTELEGQRPRHLSCMHLAALHGHTEIVDLFRKCGVSIDVRNNKKDTPVLWAARGNHIETVRYFIQHGANLRLENDKGSTPFYWAVRYGFTALVHVIAKEGSVDVNQKRKLGLYYPIILAASLGHHDIVEILLANNADPYVTINNGMTALHVAASEGECEVIRVLLDQTKLPVDQVDANGNTALLYAAQNARINAMKLLIKNGANFDSRNKQGQSVWDFTIKYHNNNFLTAVISLYKRYKGVNDLLLKFPKGNSPLHIAASTGNVEKLDCLLQQGADPKSIDLNGNTFFHVAARDNKSEILQTFLSKVSTDDVNDHGDTALHVAAKYGNLVAFQTLMGKLKLDVKNKLGMNPLHEAVFSDAANPELVRILVNHIIKANTWSLVDAVDKSDNTALHLAAKKGRHEIIIELSCLNPSIKNKDGETPLHIAAKSGIASSFDAMLSTFNKPGSGINLDEKNDQGESCLHICVRRCDINSIIRLIASGADLSLRNNEGNSVIHLLIEESCNEATRTQTLIETYQCIVKESPKWWCMNQNLQLPSEESDMFYHQMRYAMIYLTSEIYNHEGLDAINYAIERGSVEMLKEIFATPNVFKLQHDRNTYYLYDVTRILKNTATKRKNRSNSVKASDEEMSKRSRKNASSYLNTIVSLDNDILAAKILDISPINEIVQNYWKNYQWIYVVFLVIHITYMILYTIFVMPSYDSCENIPGLAPIPTQNNTIPYDESTDLFRKAFVSTQYKQYYGTKFGLFLIWPVLILLFELFFALTRLYHIIDKNVNSNKVNKSEKRCQISLSIIIDVVLSTFKTFVMNLGDVLSYCFCICAILWYALFMTGIAYKHYLIITSLVFLFGWIYLINFTKAIERLHVFTIMLRYIILRDITRFIGIYIMFLLGCGMAFNVLFQLHPNVRSINPDLGSMLYSTINMMLGLGSPFDGSFDDIYTMYGGDPVYIKTISIVYVLVSTVILLSLLVAMMTDTYTSVKAGEGSTWRVGSLRLALQLEEAMPMIKRVFKFLCMNRENLVKDVEFDRWLMPISQRKLTHRQMERSETEEMIRGMERLENRMDQFQDVVLELSRKMEILVAEKQMNTAARFVEAIVRGHAPLRFHNMANKLKKRITNENGKLKTINV